MTQLWTLLLLSAITTVGANPCPPSTNYTLVGVNAHVCIPQYGIGDNKLVCDYNTCPADLGTCESRNGGPRACHPKGAPSRQTSTQQLDAFKNQKVTATWYCDLTQGGCKGVTLPCDVETAIDHAQQHLGHAFGAKPKCHVDNTQDCWSLAAVPTRLLGNVQDMMDVTRDVDGNNKPYGYIQSGTQQGLTTSSGMCYKITRTDGTGADRTVYAAITDRCAGYCRGQATYVDKNGDSKTTSNKQREIQECSQVNRFNAQEIKSHTTCVCDNDKKPFDTTYAYSAPSFLDTVTLGVPNTCLDNPSDCCGRAGAPASCTKATCNNNDLGYIKCDHCATQLAMEFDLDVSAFNYLCETTGGGAGSAGSCKVDAVEPFACSELVTVPSGLDGRSGSTGVNCPTLPAQPKPPVQERKNVFCYVENWAQWRKMPVRPDNWATLSGPELDSNHCTHIVWAFGDVCTPTLDAGTPRRNSMQASRCKSGGQTKELGSATFFEENDSVNIREAMKVWRKINPEVKVLWSVGGWGFGPRRLSEIFKNFVPDAQGNPVPGSNVANVTFVDSVAKVIEEYGFDGFDWDWEYPGTGCDKSKVYPHNCDQAFIDADRTNFGYVIDNLHAKFANIVLPNGQNPTQHIAVHAFRWHNYPIEHMRDPSKIATVSLMSYDLAGAFSDCAAGNSPLHPETANPGCPAKADSIDGRTWSRDAFSISGALNVWSRGDSTLTGTALYAQGTGLNEGPAIPKAQLHGGVAFYARYGRTANDDDTNVQPGDKTRPSTSGVDSTGNPASCFGVRSLEPGTEFFASYSGVYEKMLNRDGSVAPINTKMLGERSNWQYAEANGALNYAYTTFDCPVKASTLPCTDSSECPQGQQCVPQPYMSTPGGKACSKTRSHFASFDDECTMSAKGHYFSSNQAGAEYGGVVVWAYTHDETRDGRYGIMRALHAGLAGKAYPKEKCQMDACVNPDGTCAAPNKCDNCFMSARRPVRGQKTCRPCISDECSNGVSGCSLDANSNNPCMFFSPAQKMCYATKFQHMECCTGVPPVETSTPKQSECDIEKYRKTFTDQTEIAALGIDPNCAAYDNSDPCGKCRSKNGCFGFTDAYCADSIFDPAQCPTETAQEGCQPKVQCHPDECPTAQMNGCTVLGQTSTSNTLGGQGGLSENTDLYCGYKTAAGQCDKVLAQGAWTPCHGKSNAEAPAGACKAAECPTATTNIFGCEVKSNGIDTTCNFKGNGWCTSVKTEPNSVTECSGCDVIIKAVGNAWSPVDSTIESGQTACWEWSGATHNLNFDDAHSGLPNAATQGSLSRAIFNTDATHKTINFHCSLHSGMQGTITVNPQSTPPPTPAPTSASTDPCRQVYNVDTTSLPACTCVPVATGINFMRIDACPSLPNLRQTCKSPNAHTSTRPAGSKRWLAGVYDDTRDGPKRTPGTPIAASTYDTAQHDMLDAFGTSTNKNSAGCGSPLKDVPRGIQKACEAHFENAACTTKWRAFGSNNPFTSAIAAASGASVDTASEPVVTTLQELVNAIEADLAANKAVWLHLKSWGVDAQNNFDPSVTSGVPYYSTEDVEQLPPDAFTGHTVAVVSVTGASSSSQKKRRRLNTPSIGVVGENGETQLTSTSEILGSSTAQALSAPSPPPTPPAPTPPPPSPAPATTTNAPAASTTNAPAASTTNAPAASTTNAPAASTTNAPAASTPSPTITQPSPGPTQLLPTPAPATTTAPTTTTALLQETTSAPDSSSKVGLGLGLGLGLPALGGLAFVWRRRQQSSDRPPRPASTDTNEPFSSTGEANAVVESVLRPHTFSWL